MTLLYSIGALRRKREAIRDEANMFSKRWAMEKLRGIDAGKLEKMSKRAQLPSRELHCLVVLIKSQQAAIASRIGLTSCPEWWCTGVQDLREHVKAGLRQVELWFSLGSAS